MALEKNPPAGYTPYRGPGKISERDRSRQLFEAELSANPNTPRLEMAPVPMQQQPGMQQQPPSGLMGQPGGFQFAPGRRMDVQQDVTPKRMQPLGDPTQFGMPPQQQPSPSQFMPMMQPPGASPDQAAQNNLDQRLEMFDVIPRPKQQGFSPQQQEMIMEGAKNVRLPMEAENAYSAATENLRKAAMNVANDPRFSQEQRAEAFQKIQSRMDEMRQNYALGKDLMTSPTGYDIPPEEIFGELQPGLTPVSGGRLRNPQTGDILATAVAPNGQVVPVARTQSEIDALPEGTSYMDPTGKVQISKAAGGKTSSTSGTSQVGGAGGFQTPEDAMKAFDTWNKRRSPNSPEERQVISEILSTLPDDQRQVVSANLEDAESIEDVLGALGPSAPPGLAQELRSAAISAFAREQGERQQTTKDLARNLGIQMPEEPRKPSISPDRYLVQTGSRGTNRVTRRGSNFSVPAVMGDDGELLIAPQTARDLGEIEVDTPFQNVREVDGKQVRMLPFGAGQVNLGDFALTDAQRKALANSTRGIAPRTEENWNQFQGELMKFAVNGVEPWDPRNPTEAQKRLQQMVGNYYSELDTPSKAAMTMMIAHSLGYQVNPDTNYSTTGWARKQFAGPTEGAPDQARAESPTRQDRVSRLATDMAGMYDDTNFFGELVSGVTRGGTRKGQEDVAAKRMIEGIFGEEIRAGKTEKEAQTELRAIARELSAKNPDAGVVFGRILQELNFAPKQSPEEAANIAKGEYIAGEERRWSRR